MIRNHCCVDSVVVGTAAPSTARFDVGEAFVSNVVDVQLHSASRMVWDEPGADSV